MTHASPAATALAIVGLVTLVYGFGVATTMALDLPWDLSLPMAVRILGLVPLAAGLAMIAWLFRYRRARDVLESTAATLTKLVHRAPIAESLGRTEPLVVVGPYRLVRHPMYSGIGMTVLGIALAVDHTWALLGALLLCAWFAFVIAPFEERELKVLFGPAYAAYMRVTPRFVPGPWRKWRWARPDSNR